MKLEVKPDLVSECALLGAMLLAPSACHDAAKIIQGPHAFSSEAHAVIYRCITEVYATTPDADLVHFNAWLESHGKAALCGGGDYLLKLATECPSAAVGKSYARLVASNYRRRRAADAMIVGVESLGSGDDADEAISRVGAVLNETDPSREQDVSLGNALSLVVPAIKAGVSDLVPIGLPTFDHEFGGIPRVGVITLLGIPGSGKSALALHIVTSTAREKNWPWRVFSFEVGAGQMAQNILAAESRVPISAVRRGAAQLHPWMEQNIDEANASLSSLDVAFVESNLNAEQIAARCSAYAASGCRAFVIDYAQNVAPSAPSQQEREKLADVMRNAQSIARNYDACVLVVSQPTLDAGRQDRALKASDVKGAQELWAGSDMLISLYRSAAARPRQADETDDDWAVRREACELHVNKNKNGMVGKCAVRFIPDQTRFE